MMTIGLDILIALEAAGCIIESDGRALRLSGARPGQELLSRLGQYKSDVRAAWCQREWQKWVLDQNRDWMRDPRPDLTQDSNRWEALLALVHADYDCDEFWWALQGMRCLGARLALVKGRLALVHGEMSAEEYAVDKATYLLPRAGEVVALLDRIGRLLNLGGGNDDAVCRQEVAGAPVDGQAQQGALSIRSYRTTW